MSCLNIATWEPPKMQEKLNENHRHLADQFEFAFLDDAQGVRLFQGGVEVCRGEQHGGQGDKVHREGEAPAIRKPLDQTDCGRRPGSGRDCGRCGSPGCSVKVSGGQGS